MPNATAAAHARMLRNLLLSIGFTLAALWLAAALVPTTWLEQLADRLGHLDDLNPDRMTRFRTLAIVLAAAHAIALWIALGPGRAAVLAFLESLARDIASARVSNAVRRLVAIATQPGRVHLAALGIVLVAAAGIRLRYLNVPMDYDEAYSFLNYARRPIYQALADYNSTNNHLLNTLAMHAAYQLAGPLEWALRLPVFVAGILLVLTTYMVGRELLGAGAALVAAALVAVNYEMVNYSVNARGYIWVAWMTLLLLLAFHRIAAGTRCAMDWVAASAAAVVGLFAMPTMIYSVFGATLWLASRLVRSGSHVRASFAALAVWTAAVVWAVVSLYAPALVFQGLSAWRHPFVRPLRFGEWLERLPATWSLAIRSWAESPPTCLLPAVAFGIGCAALLRNASPIRRTGDAASSRPSHDCVQRDCAASLMLAIALGTCAMMALQRVAPPPRVWSFLMPLFALVAAVGLETICQGAAAGWLRFRSPTSARPESSSGSMLRTHLVALVAVAAAVWGAVDCVVKRLPGGLRPTFLFEHVAPALASGEDSAEPTQLWRLDVPDAVFVLAARLEPDSRVLVALPMDLPFHFYASRREFPAAIGGRPRAGEHWFLVLRRGEEPATALRENLSLQVTDEHVLKANWKLVATLHHLAIWGAAPSPAASTD